MKIAYVTAGAAGMYCGSCLRDNTLAAGLISAGHDVTLIPTYTPTRTDELNVSEHRVFLGGINVYLHENIPGFRRIPQFMKRLLDSYPLLKLATKVSVRIDPASLGSLTVSMLQGMDGPQRGEIQDLVGHIRRDLTPDLINLPKSLLLGLAPAIKASVPVPLCCTLQGEDLFIDGLEEPYRSASLRLIRSYIPCVDRFLAVSRYCAEYMADYLGIPAQKISVVRLGINMTGYEHREQNSESDCLTIGYLARIAPEKGLHLLADSYRRLRSSRLSVPTRLRAGGYLAPEHRPYLESIREEMRAAGLAEEFSYVGELNRHEKIDFLRGVNVFSVPCEHDEPKGIFLLEALAAGVPVVQPRRGVFPEIIERTGGGILVPSNSPEALADAIGRLCREPRLREEMGACGFAGVRQHFTASAMAHDAVAAYTEVLEQRTEAARGSAAALRP